MHLDGVALIKHYFPELEKEKLLQFERLGELYTDWNSKINVISRKDQAELYLRHVLHSLAIAKLISFKPGTSVFDLGSGGGFPGIPLAILFPETQFMLCDSVAKKMRVAGAISEALLLTNVQVFAGRSEAIKGHFDFVVSRAVAEFSTIRSLTLHLAHKKQRNMLPNGWICLKGGDLHEELAGFKKVQEFDIARWFSEPFFETKKLAYIPFQ